MKGSVLSPIAGLGARELEKKLNEGLPILIMFNQEQEEEELSESDTGKIIALGNCGTVIHIFRYIVNYSGFHHECLMLDVAL